MNHSVVIPTFNGATTIDATIRSVMAQTTTDFELILVDDGSSDSTVQHIEKWRERETRIRVIEQANQGTAGARNAGIKAAQGGLISFLDGDDLWMPTYLSRVATAFSKSPATGLVFSDAWVLDDATLRIRRMTTMGEVPKIPGYCTSEERLLQLIESNFIVASSTTVSREALDRVGLLDPGVSGADDYDLWLRIVAAGFEASQATGRNVVLRDRPDSQSKNLTHMRSAQSRVLKRLIADPGTPRAGRASAKRQVDRLDREIRALTGKAPISAFIGKTHRHAAKVKNRIAYKRRWPSNPPEEVSRELSYIWDEHSIT